MKRNFHFLILFPCFLFFKCNNEANKSEFTEIKVDIDQNISLSLSEITEEITVIQPELSKESVINPEKIKRIIFFEDLVIVAEQKIVIFTKEGKFLRNIGSKGQGPGEYLNIRNIAFDEINKQIFVNNSPKIICYDLNGNFIRESSSLFQHGGVLCDMNYIDNELLIIVDHIGRKDSKGLFNRSVLYKINNDLHIVDSCIIRDTYFERPGSYSHPYKDFILNGNSKVFLYYSDNYFAHLQMPAETVLRDTLYRLEKNCLVPELKLKFKNDGIDGGGNKFIELFNLYRSSRYVFAVYGNTQNNNNYRFCYDSKTGKGYNMQDGYTDDINKIEKRVSIRPSILNTEYFYYWQTNMKPDDREEPNPTLYIGRLKN